MNRKDRRKKHITKKVVEEKVIKLPFNLQEKILEVVGGVGVLATMALGVAAVMKGNGVGMLIMLLEAVIYAIFTVFVLIPQNAKEKTKKSSAEKEIFLKKQHNNRMLLQCIRFVVTLGAIAILISLIV